MLISAVSVIIVLAAVYLPASARATRASLLSRDKYQPVSCGRPSNRRVIVISISDESDGCKGGAEGDRDVRPTGVLGPGVGSTSIIGVGAGVEIARVGAGVVGVGTGVEIARVGAGVVGEVTGCAGAG